MLEALLQEEVQQYIKENESVDINQLLLKRANVAGVSTNALATQLNGQIKAKTKLPEWYKTDNIIYPAKISMEQCSSEQSARYKAEIISGEKMIDLTGGAGVDTHAFSKKFSDCSYIEQQQELHEITSHNLRVLGVKNVTTYCTTAEQFLEEHVAYNDLIYLDPSRRNSDQKKVFRFEDCTPNIAELLPSLLKKADHIMVKTAPFLDITQALNQLNHVQQVHVVAVNNECKEVLYLLSGSVIKERQIMVHTVNLRARELSQQFSFELSKSTKALVNYALPNTYIYEPNSAILKGGGINSVGQRYGVDKLHPNSQLFTNEHLIKEFPGRIFECMDVLKYDKKVIKKAISAGKANITTRNFPYDVAQIRKKTGLKDGGDNYLFATTNMNNEKIILSTKKLNNPMR